MQIEGAAGGYSVFKVFGIGEISIYCQDFEKVSKIIYCWLSNPISRTIKTATWTLCHPKFKERSKKTLFL